MFAQAHWREQASEAWCTEQVSRNPSVPWTMLLMPTADAAQWRVSLHRSSDVCTNIWMLRWRVCGWVHQESMQLSRLVIILAEDIQKGNTYHRRPVPFERIYSKVGIPLRIFPTRSQLSSCLWCWWDTYWIEESGTVCPPQVFHSWELEFMSSRVLKRTYALCAPAGE